MRSWATALVVLLATAAGAQEVPRVAVLDLLGVDGAVKAGEARYLTDQVRGAAVKALGRGFRVVTRENIVDLLKSVGKSLEECSQAECATEYGRMLGADYVVTGEVLKFGEQFKATLRVHQTDPPELLASVNWGGATLADLDKGLGEHATRLLGAIASGAPGLGRRQDGILFLRVDVDGVDWSLDGGLESGTLRKDQVTEVRVPLRSAAYRLRLTRKGYHDYAGEVRLYGEHSTYTVDHAMVKVVHVRPTGGLGVLDVVSEPANAEILVDGKVQAGRKTPTSLEVAAGTHLVQVRRRAYRPWSGEVTVGVAGITPLKITLEPNFGTLKLTVAPPEAEIYLNDQRVGSGSYHNQRQVVGGYAVRVVAPLHHAYRGTLFVERRRSVSKTITLKPAFGTIEITVRAEVDDGSGSAPSVFLDGAPALGSPRCDKDGRALLCRLTIDRVPSGAHELEVQRPHYRLWTGRVKVADGRATPVRIDLDSRFGTLLVTSVPPGAEVLVDGRPAGRTPLERNVSAGTHKVAVQPPAVQYRAFVQDVVVAKNARVAVKAALVVRKGALTIMTEPRGAEVFVDGKRLGTSPVQALDLPVGLRRVEARKAGWTSTVSEIAVEEGRARLVRIELGRLGAVEVTCKIPPGEADGVAIELDGQRHLGATHRFEGLETGEHTVRCLSGKGHVVTRMVRAVPGQSPSLTLDLADPRVLRAAWERRRNVHLWTGVGLAVVAAGAGIAGGILVSDAYDLDAQVPGAIDDWAAASTRDAFLYDAHRIVALQDERDTKAIAGWTAVGVAGAGLVAAIVLWSTSPSRPEGLAGGALPTPGLRPLPGGAVLTLTGGL